MINQYDLENVFTDYCLRCMELTLYSKMIFVRTQHNHGTMTKILRDDFPTKVLIPELRFRVHPYQSVKIFGHFIRMTPKLWIIITKINFIKENVSHLDAIMGFFYFIGKLKIHKKNFKTDVVCEAILSERRRKINFCLPPRRSLHRELRMLSFWYDILVKNLETV